MSAGTAPAPPLALGPRSGARPAAVPTAVTLSAREAGLRAVAVACLVGMPLAQAVELPALLHLRPEYAIPALAAMALCVGLSVALAASPAGASRRLWRSVAGTATLVLAGWGAPHAVALPGLANARGAWGSPPGALSAALAVACLVTAATAARPTVRGLATALAVLVAFGPGVGALVVAVAPGPAGGATAITADVHVHAHSTAPESDIVLRRGPRGNHYLTPVFTRPYAPPAGVALLVVSASIFACGTIAHLRRRRIAPPAARALDRTPA